MKTILVTCVDWDISFAEFPDKTAAQKAMLDQMAKYGGIEPDLVNSECKYNSPDFSFEHDEYWGWTTNNVQGAAECEWLIKEVNEVMHDALLAEWRNHNLHVTSYSTLAEAQKAMRSSMLLKCRPADVALIEENVSCVADDIRFDAMSAFLTKSTGSFAWEIHSLKNDARAISSYLGNAGIHVKQSVVIYKEEMNEINDLVSGYTPDMDSINYGQTLIPFQWEFDFGDGWTVSIDVVAPVTVKEHWEAYCEAVLYRNGEIVHRSIRDNHLDGVWGLRYNNYLFQVEVKES